MVFYEKEIILLLSFFYLFSIMKVSEKCEQTHIKPTKLTIREFGTAIGVENLTRLRILKIAYEHPPSLVIRFYRSSKTLFLTFFIGDDTKCLIV